MSGLDKLYFSPGGEAPCAYCDLCLGEVYDDDLVHLVDGFIICPECFDDFAFDYFSPYFITGAELKEIANDTYGTGCRVQGERGSP